MRRDDGTRRIKAEMLCIGDNIERNDGARLHVLEVVHSGCYPTKVRVQPTDLTSPPTWLSLFTGELLKVSRR